MSRDYLFSVATTGLVGDFASHNFASLCFFFRGTLVLVRPKMN